MHPHFTDLPTSPLSVVDSEELTWTSHRTDQPISESQPAEDLDGNVTKKQLQDLDGNVTKKQRQDLDGNVTKKQLQDLDGNVTEKQLQDLDGNVTKKQLQDLDGNVTKKQLQDLDGNVTEKQLQDLDGNVTKKQLQDLDGNVTEKQLQDLDGNVTKKQLQDLDGNVTEKQLQDLDGNVTKKQLQDLDGNVTEKQLQDLDGNVTKKQLQDSLRALINCTTPFVSLTVLTKDDQDMLLSFSTLGNGKARHMTSLKCQARLTSGQRYVISAVLLEHSVCGEDGGVFVLLRDNTTRRPWDVCSAWLVPGPDFVTSSNAVDVSIQLIDVTYPCKLALSIRAIEKPRKRQLELRYLSTTEGKAYLFVLFCFVCYLCYLL